MSAEIAGGELSLPSFRDGVAFEPKKPDVDGFIRVIDIIEGPKGQMMKVVVFEVLKRSFPDVSLEEVGAMEFEDFAVLMKVGMSAMNELNDMGFPDTSAM